MKKKKTISRILVVLFTVAMAACFVPQTGALVFAANEEEEPVPAMALGAAVLNQDVNTADAQTVYYGSAGEAVLEWRVIGYDGTGAASASGAVTLLSSETLGQTKFDESGNKSNVYANSELRRKIEGYDAGGTHTDGILDTFSYAEQSAIVKKTLKHGTYNGENTDCVAGDEDLENALLWPLSTKEAGAVNKNLRKADPEHTGWKTSIWWLASPGKQDNYTAYVSGDGNVAADGDGVGLIYGVRPAFCLDPESVLFTSAATGGKSSGDTGPDALKAQSDQTNLTNEWKVTVKDESHKDFKVTQITGRGNGVSVKYQGAQTGENEYISAIFTDKPITEADAKITWYGRIKSSFTSSSDVWINTKDKLGENEYFYIFNEQYNGDRKTDYASDLFGVFEENHVHREPDGKLMIFEPWTGTDSLPSKSGNYYLTDDVVYSGEWIVKGTIGLCLGGHHIVFQNDQINKGRTVINPTLTFNLYDCKETGSISNGNPESGCVIYNMNGTFNMYGGTISGNTAKDSGGGVLNAVGTFNMFGGTITGNNAEPYGGGVYVAGGTFNMYGGTISGNSAHYGGGVCVDGWGTFNMSGGTISGNRASVKGGGVAALSKDGGIQLSGSPVIAENTVNDKTNNIYLDPKVRVTGELNTPAGSSGPKLGVNMYSPGVFTDGLSGNLPTGKTITDLFFSDDADHVIEETEDGEAKWLLKKDKTDVIFKATGEDTGKLTGVENGLKYRIGDGAWTDITGSDDVGLTGLSACSVFVVRSGDGLTTADSDAQEIKVTKAEKPSEPQASDCTTPENKDGKITGVKAGMEYKKAGETAWTEVTGNEVTGLTPGTYSVRVKANKMVLASESLNLTVKGKLAKPKFRPDEGKYIGAKTVTITGPDGATIHYTTDGTNPTADSPAYSKVIPLADETKETTIKAIAVKEGMVTSDIATATYIIEATDDTLAKKQAKISLDAGLKGTSSKGHVTAKWGKVKDADGYDVYAAYCEGNSKYKKIKTVSGKVNKLVIKKMAGKKLNLKRSVKYYVVAYKTINGKKTKLAKSLHVHVVGSANKGWTNIKSIKVTKKAVTLKKGKTAKIKAKLVLYQKGRKTLDHERKFRYATSNDKVAKVSKNGKIKAIGKGKCDIYVYAQNGCAKKIRVTVK